MRRGQRAWLGAVALLYSVLGLASAMEDNAPGTTGLLEAAVGGKRTLVLADSPQIQDSHSMFFSALKVRETAVQCKLQTLWYCRYIGTTQGRYRSFCFMGTCNTHPRRKRDRTVTRSL